MLELARVLPRNGPPLAVSQRRATSGRARPAAHWWIAQCSESTGTISPPPRVRAALDHRPAGDERLLVGEAEPLPGVEGGEGDGQAGEADHRVEDHVDVGVGGERGERVGVVEAGPGPGRVDAELGRLGGEQLDVAARGESDDVVAVAVVPDQLQGLGADRAGRPQDRDASASVGEDVQGQVVRGGEREEHRVEAV